MTGLLVTLVVLAGLLFYVGFALRERIYWRWLSQASFVVCLPLIAAVSYAAWQERIAVTQLSSFIDPYTPISAVTWAPPVPGEGSRHWIVTTPDPPVRVVSFYETGTHLRGWDVLERGPSVLVLRKETACLSLFVTRQSGARTGASIVYALVPKCS